MINKQDRRIKGLITIIARLVFGWEDKGLLRSYYLTLLDRFNPR